MGWETTIRTGSQESDQQALAQCDAQARAQGLVLRTNPMPGGGFHVAAVAPTPSYAPPAPQYGAPAQYGGPPAYPSPSYAPPAYGAPAPYGGPAPAYNPYQQQAAPMGGYGYAGNPYAAPQQQAQVGGRCNQCGVHGPTKHVTFMQNVGMLVVRFPSTRSGHMCRRCINRFFWQYTLVTTFFGWWGVISFFYSVVSIPMNIISYIGASGLGEPPQESYARMGIASEKWPGWRIAIAVIGIVFALCSLLWSAAAIAGIIDAIQGGDAGGVVAMIVMMLLSWILPVWMLWSAFKRPKIAPATATA